MGKNWYQDLEDDLDERNEAIGRAFVAANNPELVTKDPEPARSEPVQLSIFGDEEKEVKEKHPKQGRVGSTRGTEYILLTKRGQPVRVRYEEGYGPELLEEDDDDNEIEL